MILSVSMSVSVLAASTLLRVATRYAIAKIRIISSKISHKFDVESSSEEPDSGEELASSITLFQVKVVIVAQGEFPVLVNSSVILFPLSS